MIYKNLTVSSCSNQSDRKLTYQTKFSLSGSVLIDTRSRAITLTRYMSLLLKQLYFSPWSKRHPSRNSFLLQWSFFAKGDTIAILRKLDVLSRLTFVALCFSTHHAPSEIVSTRKGKNLLPLGVNSFLSEKIFFR